MFHVKQFRPETIAAIATPIGAAGMGIVRVSGPGALLILQRVLRRQKSSITPRKMIGGWLVNPRSKEKIDQVLACFMKGPKSYTGEDTAEIYCHGGETVVREGLEALLKAGARLAEPGEFTKRAFLNGKMDLAQAEAVIELISSKTKGGLGLAIKQLEGKLSRRVTLIRDKLVSLVAELEVGIDFPDDVDTGFNKTLSKKIKRLKEEIARLTAGAIDSRIYRQGIKTVITGRPNVGKSSLLNALLREERAIVTDIPGTTRDSIEELYEVRGLPIAITDTAGIDQPKDRAEAAGVGRAIQEKESADVLLYVVDGSQKLNKADQEGISELKGRSAIVVINKADLKQKITLKEIKGEKVVSVSAKSNFGIKNLEMKLEKLVGRHFGVERKSSIYLSARHRESLENAARSLQLADSATVGRLPIEAISIDLKGAIISLGEVTGETVSEEVVNEIFKRFCVGK